MTSPARRQYLDLKRQYPDAILLYRLGDFYEMFDADAETASRVLGIQLTARSYPKGEGRVPMAGVPHHSVDAYIKRLLDAGHRVALCEQTSEQGKGLVDRDVVRVFTPGTIVEPEMLQPGQNNYLAAVAEGRSTTLGLAHVDVTTGEFAACEFAGPNALPEVESELLRLLPAECLVPDGSTVALPTASSNTRSVPGLDASSAAGVLKRKLAVSTLAGFGLDGKPAAVSAAAMIVAYLEQTNPRGLEIVDGLRTYSTDAYMTLDRYTRSSLDLVPDSRAAERRWSLLRVVDRTRTAMGRRMLRALLGRPLLEIDQIRRRLDAVEELTRDPVLIQKLSDRLSRIGDIERIITRVGQRKVTSPDLTELRLSLQEVQEIRALLEAAGALETLRERLDPCRDTCRLIEDGIDVETGGSIRAGYNAELDGLRSTLDGARGAMAQIERTEASSTGIKALKVAYNKVFGYYIEIPKSSAHLAPSHYIRQQTLVNGERFVTPQIKELEAEILGARESAEALERRLLEDILVQIESSREAVMGTAGSIAELDCFRSLADVALANNYVRPVLDSSSTLEIVQGRHPIVEAATHDMAFVPNDCRFDEDARIIVLTGPNMGGKSTMLRMVALVVLMAQIGSFVPADEARIGIVDRIFSRVGAQDDIAAGQSTFMTEMVETSNILHHASSRSLLILDEIGRGTSTYDGLAIARAVVEFIHSRLRARTLFATHYHELTRLSDELDGVRNFHTAVADHEGKVVFLHQVVPGGADRSYGIHVARLAGLPHSVTVRAERILRQLERMANGTKPAPGPQLALFTDPDLAPRSETEAVAIRILDQLLALDLETTTPLEALERLHRLQEEGRSSR